MADIYGVVIGGTNSTPQNGVTVTLWSSAVVPTLPAENTAPPGSGSSGTATTGSAHGADGAFQFTGIGSGTYFLSWVLAGNTYWSEYQVPYIGSALATFNTAGGLTLGSASDLLSGANGLYTAGTLHAAATTLTSTLAVSGAVTLSGAGTALSVTNAITAASLTLSGAGTALSVTNNALISGTLTLAGTTGLSVTNASTFNGQATFTGTGYGIIVNNNLQVLGTLSVATLTPTTFTVSGATTLNGAVSATAAGTSLAVTNNQTIGGTLTISGASTALTVTNAASIANLTLTGSGNGLVVNNNALVSGNLVITGSLSAGSYSPTTLSTTGALSSGSTLAVTGLSTLTGGFSSLAASTVSIAAGTPLSVSTTADTTASTAALTVTENATHSSAATLVAAVQGTAVNKGTGGSATVAGVYANLIPLSGTLATGGLTLAAGLWAASPSVTGRGANNVTVTTMAGLRIDDQNPTLTGLTTTNVHALDIGAQTGASSYAIYSAGGAHYLKSGAAAQVTLTLDTFASPSSDILDINVAGAKTAYFTSAGSLTLSATGTGLTVTNNALVSGNLTVTGTLTAGTYSPATLSTTGALTAGTTLTVTTAAAINGTPNAATQQLYVKANAIGVIPLVLDTPSGQTGNLQNWNVNGSTLALMDSTGSLTVVGAKSTTLAVNGTLPGSVQSYVKSSAVGTIPLVIDTPASPTAKLQSWRANGSEVASISAAGVFAGGIALTSLSAKLSSDANVSGATTTLASVSLTAGTWLIIGNGTVESTGTASTVDLIINVGGILSTSSYSNITSLLYGGLSVQAIVTVGSSISALLQGYGFQTTFKASSPYSGGSAATQIVAIKIG